MKGHNYGICRKCGKIHEHPRGGSKQKGMKKKPCSEERRRKISESMKGRTPWNKGLTKETDNRVALYGKSVARSWTTKERQTHKIEAGVRLGKAGKKYIKEHPEHQSEAGRLGGLKSIILVRKKLAKGDFISKEQKELYDIVTKYYPNVVMEHPVSYGGKGETKFLDIAIPELKLDFEFDSDYWHTNKQDDRDRDKILMGLGWKVIRINRERLKQIKKEGLKW